MTSSGACPLCGEQLFGWIAMPPPGDDAGVGERVEPDRERVLDRCENCGVALEHGREVDVATEWEAICRPGEGGDSLISIPDRGSLQAWFGEFGWAALDRYPGRLVLSAPSLERLAAINGHTLSDSRTPRTRRAQAWMWQTLLNGLTFHRNFAREVRAGRLRAANARSRFAYAVDWVVTVLGAPLVLLVSAPLELGASLVGRGGERTATAHRLER